MEKKLFMNEKESSIINKILCESLEDSKKCSNCCNRYDYYIPKKPSGHYCVFAYHCYMNNREDYISENH